MCLCVFRVCLCALAKLCLCVYFCRCVAICSLGLWVCEELGQRKIHHQVNDAINVLGVTLKVSVFSVQSSNVGLYRAQMFCGQEHFIIRHVILTIELLVTR